jgi:hypothetical protein
MTRLRRWTLLAAVACFPASAGTDPLDAQLRVCAGIAEATQRLACFDALVPALPKVKADQFGMTAEIAQKRDPVAAEQKKNETLPGKIVALGQTSNGRWIFTLDNQQVWVQAEPQPTLRFEVGEAVHIEHGVFTSLWLAADKNRKTRVTRVQ